MSCCTRRFAFFTVSDPEVGLGHLYRCDALASALREQGYETQLLIHCGAGQKWLKQRAPESPWRIVMWKNEPATVRELAAQHDTVIVDAYDIAPGVHEALQAAARCPVYFDDVGENIPERGVVINGSPGAHLIGYPERAGLVLLLGTEYQVLRRPFWTAPRRVVREEIKAVGVMLGGTDHSGLMNTVAATVRSAVPAAAKVIAVGADPFSVNVAGVQATGRLTASGIKALFDELDLLVTAAGQTVAEAVSCLLPTVMIQTAENQHINVPGWTNTGAVQFSDHGRGQLEVLRLTLVDAKSFDNRSFMAAQAAGLSINLSTSIAARSLSKVVAQNEPEANRHGYKQASDQA